MTATDDPGAADLVVVNTCAFIEEARKESIDTILALDEQRRDGARLVVTGCMAERYGAELAEALPEVDQVAGFGVPVDLGAPQGTTLIPVSSRCRCPTLDLLNLPRPRVDVAVGVRQDRRGLRPLVRVLRDPVVPRPAAQPRRRIDPRRGRRARRHARSCSSPRTWRRTARTAPASSAPARSCRSCRPSPSAVDWVRLLYLYPSDLTDESDRRHLRHRRAVLRPVAAARQQAVAAPDAALGRRRPLPAPDRRHPRRANRTPRSAATSSSAIRARPRPTTTSCCEFVEAAQLDWCGFFAYIAGGRHVRGRPRRRRRCRR